ncbi:hypothetical protein Y1Q_0003573 [Alligator mississippiensis]|uniref:SH3 domain-containing protein n=1 Tax=Alligator mississippiensis TaxID=8496 RepID=A0A151NGA7_ALLMI|nr:hypothetical protein Y1Q_0003573 [Alligator mississippiensis]
MASQDGLQYRALYEYQKARDEDLALAPGDLLTVSVAGLPEGDERSPQGWLSGLNERTKERGDFPGTYVEYVGPVRVMAIAPKARPRPVPPAPPGAPAGQLRGPMEAAEHTSLPEQAPVAIRRLLEALEKQGVESEALYRSLPGAAGHPELRQALLTGKSPSRVGAHA